MSINIKALLCCVLWLKVGLTFGQQGLFMENAGQWEGDFDFRHSREGVSVFISAHEVVYNYQHYETSDDHPHHQHLAAAQGHAYKTSFLKARRVKALPMQASPTRYNYLLGRDQSRWKSGLFAYHALYYAGIYPQIDLQWHFSERGHLKYDLIIQAGGDPTQIALHYEGISGIGLSEGDLLLQTSLGEIRELQPYAYQQIDGEIREVAVAYQLIEDTLRFALGHYDPAYPLTIDPELVFSTYSGSLSDNWGYTATYGKGGTAYGGSIVFVGMGTYPTTLGAWRDTAQGGTIDIAISKFSADGSSLIYSTYLGGSNNEMPYSLIEGQNGELIILGNTGSPDFPVLANSFQDSLHRGFSYNFFNATYPWGSDIFVLKLDSSGGQVLASTYLGGGGVDGINDSLKFNYGDDFRGEVFVDSLGTIYGVTSTYSDDFPMALNPSAYQGKQDGIAFALSGSLDNLLWSRYVGGSDNDALFSIKEYKGMVYLAGVSSSPDVNVAGAGGAHTTYFGGVSDGMLLKLNAADGTPLAFTYNGTAARDANFFVDFNFQGEVYIFGQSTGDYPQIGNGLYSNPNGAQFLHQWDANLQSSIRSTVFGSGRAVPDISPTALMVDDCQNVYISGWGGATGTQKGSTRGLAVTNSAYRANTDGNDFYFMVLDGSWRKLNYATFFGSNMKDDLASDHVDGGTSRFSKDGTIYQAVCAGCGGFDSFPTSPNAYSDKNLSFNCNLGLVKFTIESDEVQLDLSLDLDSSCVPFISNITDKSYNADIILWLLPNGDIDTLQGNTLTIKDTGRYQLTFVGLDTLCGFSDTLQLDFYGFAQSPMADFSYQHDSCDGSFLLEFFSNSTGADAYLWDFGDGSISNLRDPAHLYSKAGNYRVMLIVRNIACNLRDTIYKDIEIKARTGNGSFTYAYDPCAQPIVAQFSTLGEGFENYRWYVDGQLITDSLSMFYTFPGPGNYEVRLQSLDSLCDRYYDFSETVVIRKSGVKIFVPNVFTPNGDQINDEFSLLTNDDLSRLQDFYLQIFNRDGRRLYESRDYREAWDGRWEDQLVPEGVYFYLLKTTDACGKVEEQKGFLHLSS